MTRLAWSGVRLRMCGSVNQASKRVSEGAVEDEESGGTLGVGVGGGVGGVHFSASASMTRTYNALLLLLFLFQQ